MGEDIKSNNILNDIEDKLKDTDSIFSNIQEKINIILEKELKDNIDSFYIDSNIDEESLTNIVNNIEFRFDGVEFEVKFKIYNNNILIYLKYNIISGVTRRKEWRFSVSNIIRWKKLRFLFG